MGAPNRAVSFAALVLGTLALLGCASASTYESWRGRNIDDLQFSWGPPARAMRLSDGRTMVAYEHGHFVRRDSLSVHRHFLRQCLGDDREHQRSGQHRRLQRLAQIETRRAVIVGTR